MRETAESQGCDDAVESGAETVKSLRSGFDTLRR